jgi:uncharacterized protein (DUF885 family)
MAAMGAVRRLADRHLSLLCALDPNRATALGVRGHDHQLTDYSPDGVSERIELSRHTLVDLASTAVDDEDDRRCAALLRDRLTVEIDSFEAGEHLRPLRLIGSPVSGLRSVFDLTPRQTESDWLAIAQRIEAVPQAYAQFVRSLRVGKQRRIFAAPRQAVACADQADTWAGANGQPWFATYVQEAPAPLRKRLDEAARRAAAALTDLAHFLRHEYAPAAAGQPDAVGRERYALAVRQHQGTKIDVDETYAWAWEELDRIETEMARCAGQIVAGGSIADALGHLDTAGPALEGTDRLLEFLQDLIDRTIEELSGTHFDIAPPLRACRAMLAPPGSAAAQYYTPPTPDFRRPGQTWNPPLGRTRFPVWSEVSTCYHEAVPGHHLQFGQWTYLSTVLSRYQTSTYPAGNIEGWALYAERLMDELGYLGDPGNHLGYLVAQQLRATRVIVDIGMHNELALPLDQSFYPGDILTPELGHQFLLEHAGRDRAFLDSEFVRYLGWPAQAISYKLGERVWLAGREAARRAHGAGFDLKRWHMNALSLGGLGLDDLADELVRC